MRVFIAALVLGFSVSVTATPAYAQQRVDVQFPRGHSGTTVNGTVIGDEYIDYVVRASARQHMTASLKVDGTNGNGSIYFNIIPEGQDYGALFVGSNGGRSANVMLPDDGTYVIRVYLMGNDRDAGKTVGFSLALHIAGAVEHPSAAHGGNSDTWYTRLVGAASDGAVSQLQLNGFEQVDTFESGNNAFGTVWYNRSNHQCLQVIIANGRVDSSNDIQTHPRCR